MRIPFISALAVGALALGGCAYSGLGLGVGYGGGYGSYGYSPYYGSSYGAGYGYSPYGYSRYGNYGYSSPYYGWYDDYYYPGTSYYVYDAYRRPYSMTTPQRQYWSKRSPALSTSATRTTVKPNWSGFTAKSTTREQRKKARDERRSTRRY